MRIAVILLASAALVSACGLRGDLERPVPLFGNPPNEGLLDPRTIKAAEEAAAKKKAEDEAARAAEQPAATPTPTPPQ
jgi:hypothetical protein